MCGIAGLFRFSSPPELAPLARMGDSLAHRGPDDGHLVRFSAGGLAVRRLAIMDPQRGRQPLCDASGRFWVALNGEIYNHQSLHREWAARGTLFKTHCDTEVVAEVVASLGFRRALARFNGMFALAVYDSHHDVLWMARDRMGEKPLYYTTLTDGTFLFGSELKALLCHPALPRVVDPVAVEQYLLFEFIPSPRTIYRGVHRLNAASLLRLDSSGLRVDIWWQAPAPEGGSGGPRHLDRWARSLATAFQVSVLNRRRADVPIGFLLSGGLDSSSVLAVAARIHPAPLRTFTLTLPEPSFDESGPAREVARHFSCEHNEIAFNPHNLHEVLDEMMGRLDEPLGDSSLPITWWLMRHVKAAGLKVVLSGDGGDELLAGYPTYLAHRLVPLLRPLSRPLGRLADRLPVSYDNVSLDYKVRRFCAGLTLPLARRNQVWLGAFLPSDLPPTHAEQVWQEIDAAAAPLEGLPAVCQAMALDQRFYLGDDVLVKVDRASQAHGVEVRAPFLDHHFVELAAQVPVGLKLRGLRTKAVWKRAVAQLLPAEIRHRPKKGFGTPVGPWLRGPCAHLLTGLEDQVADWVEPQAVRRWALEHQRGQRDHRRRLWSLLVLSRWLAGPFGPG